ncbi:leukocyte receptor cluster member 1 homolog [Physella acuta]|uniref:leukocyte receptor cluster member 1 homolog n=1 Tax=Physella acuta TaxID=109671 RepID=UPI0027DDAB63|nr:leukocyte receptor cluster member 1 homolog [Physella acuta]XP_059162107.1 leukocyte receptor cluster member 1 homolog [Physella acuta]XP_059162115.1 leukocyte receptor cluster member 1 homolog [Physella acuta]XP_059162124.1 leukocyte receptor cluster member 1 homolog [Physella acuta]XP_059162130.1 leukocyte receptor cluster member 1 homolog [Physella acuta]XP_059162136.1 leukocyte receptor cluster member 1 homolog [Physella acuta]XP_059162146.1 leukocyte receptor cluster member 1 homolog 
MNILPHKSWHVRTKKNIERVRKDEENAASEEKEKQRRIALAEQEARTALLRAKNQSKSKDLNCKSLDIHNSTTSSEVASKSSSRGESGSIPKEHINFFKEIEDGLIKQGSNKDNEAEKKHEKDQFEKKIGLLTYLGQSAQESKGSPWDLHHSVKKRRNECSSVKEESEAESQKDCQKLINYMDPLVQMNQYIKKKNHSKEKTTKKEAQRKHSDSKKETSKTASKKTIEQMRQERLLRETHEKLRAQAILSPKIEKQDAKCSENNSEVKRSNKRKYNSQYNPDLF